MERSHEEDVDDRTAETERLLLAAAASGDTEKQDAFFFSAHQARTEKQKLARRKRKMVVVGAAVFAVAYFGLGALAAPRPQEQSSVGSSTITGAPQSSGATASGTSTATSYSVQYTLPASIDAGIPRLPNVLDSQAVDPQSVCPGYTLTNAQNTSTGITATLVLAGAACNVYGNDVDTLTLTVDFQADDRLFVGIKPAYTSPQNETWFILPEDYIMVPPSNGAASPQLSFGYTNNPTFNFNITRISNGDVLFTTVGRKLVYEDQFIQFGTNLPTNYNVYGLGEVIHGLRLNRNLTRTIFAADAGDPIDGNIYGSHPVYYETRYFDGETLVDTESSNSTSGNYTSLSHAVYLRNAHPQEVWLRSEGLTWHLLGGSMDLYFYAGPTINDIGPAYQKTAVGLPVEQQFWAFGYHQCRWGYENWTVMQTVLDNFVAAQIPVETLWNDIDYMKSYRDFENDPIRFPYNNTFIPNLLASGRHWVPIVDSAIYIPNPANASDAYEIYTRGNNSGAFLNNPDGSQYVGAVWPGLTVFPDWLAPNGQQFWVDEVKTWHNSIPFSGIWIDMSEVSSFCVGSCGTPELLAMNPVHPPFNLPGEPGSVIYTYPEGFNLTNATEAAAASSAAASQSSAQSASATPTATDGANGTASVTPTSTGSSSTSYLRTTPTPGVRDVTYPPFVLNNIQGGDLGIHAVSTNATHANGVQEYDWHNLFGHQILNATYQGLLAVNSTVRPFIIGRSTFAGSGQYAGHWGGDNTALFAYMYFSIPQALSFSLFGIPMFGVDTCGFNGNTDMELCARWMQLSAFFPFYRNHNTLSANSQEPYVWETVAEAARSAMAVRYSLLNYIYTLFHQAHTNGTFVMRALAWEFPNDPTLAGTDTQFFLGPALLITPVLAQGATTVNGVFPGSQQNQVYYDYYNQSAVPVTAENVTIAAPLGFIPVYIRGGYILPLQEPGQVTNDVRNSSWALTVALNMEGGAGGYLYIDDGVSINPSAIKEVQMAATNTSLTATVSGEYVDGNALANVTVLGVSTAPSVVMFGSQNITTFTYSDTTKVLAVTGLETVASAAWAQNWELTWM